MKSIIALPNDYVVVDIETTGTHSGQDEMIELSAIKYRNGKEVSQFSQLLKPQQPVRSFITSLTGITNEMLENAPTVAEVIANFDDFIEDDILIGHNIASFDSVFISLAYEKYLNKKLENSCVDTMRISKKVIPKLPHNSLDILARRLNVEQENAHRGIADCKTTNLCYQKLRNMILEQTTVEEFQSRFIKKTDSKKISELNPTKETICKDHPLFGKKIVFTGSILLTRHEAMQLSVDFGAILQTGVTTKTDILVVGTQDLDRVGNDGMSSKQEKAIRFNETGMANIQIITEDEFINMAK